MIIRQAVAGDLPGVMEIIRAVIPLMHKVGNYQWTENYPDERRFSDDISDGTLYVAVGESDEQIDGVSLFGVGALTTDQPPEYTEVGYDISQPAVVVHRLAVHPLCQGRGVARLLMEKAEELAREKKYDYLRVDTFEHNLTMQRLFEKLGYVYAGEIGLLSIPGVLGNLRFRCYEKKLVY